MVWHQGQLLYGGRYIIEKQLGEGGFGITYLARDKRRNWVVIKTLKPHLLGNSSINKFHDKNKHDFRDEALRLALCRHPHIVQIENAFYEGNLPCIAMEYVGGEDLWQRVAGRGILSEAEALVYIRQIGAALTLIHDKGLLHRDVKPQNIMVRAGKQEAVLIDFGVAREFIPNLTQSWTQALTPGFAPIEQYAFQARWGEFTDVYALAATLYYLLTGQVPTSAPARAASIRLDSPKQFNANISNIVNRAIIKGMDFKAENRPQSVQDWLAMFGGNQIVGYTTKQQVSSISQIPVISNQIPTAITPPPAIHRRTSARGIDYRNLQAFLALGKWQEADRETAALMLKICDRENEGWLRIEDIKNFPSKDLSIIDQLWRKHSKGRFGFSIQKQIWDSVGGQVEANYETLCKWGDRVGWRLNRSWIPYERFIFDECSAPLGHLPSGYVFSEVGWWVGLLNLFYRLE